MLNQFDINALQHVRTLDDIALILDRSDLYVGRLVHENVKVKVAVCSLSASQAVLRDVKNNMSRFRLAAYYGYDSFKSVVNSVFNDHMHDVGFISNYQESDVLAMLKPFMSAINVIRASRKPGADAAYEHVNNLVADSVPELIYAANDAVESEYCAKLDNVCERVLNLIAEMR